MTWHLVLFSMTVGRRGREDAMTGVVRGRLGVI